VVFNVYFAQRVVPPEGILIAGVVLRGPFLWSLAVALSTFVIFVLAPLLGAIADIAGRRKSFLAFFWALGALSTSALVFVTPGRVGLALALSAWPTSASRAEIFSTTRSCRPWRRRNGKAGFRASAGRWAIWEVSCAWA
jgi:MFS-type transporter involved in bile tolerance (Atg22 family)